MAHSTAKTYLMYKATEVGVYAKLIDITNYPDLGATPSKLDTTDLSAEKFKTSILGLQEIPDLVFEANYTKTAYALVDGLAGNKLFLQLQFGEAGVDGMFSWQGEVSVFAMAGEVDGVRKMQVTCSAETEIVAS